MATHRTAIIPFSRLIKVGIWSNESKKSTISAVYKQLKEMYSGKEIYISNGGFFTMNSKIHAMYGLKASDVVYSDNWNMAFMGMNGKTIRFCQGGADSKAYTDAVSAYPVLIENGKKSKYFTHCIDNSDRGRTMLGYTDSEIVLSCIADTAGTSDFTLDEELNYMLSLKCKYAINLDGGGSSQCNFNGSTISSSRIVSNFVYMVVEPEVKTTNITTTTIKSSYSVGSVIRLKSGATYTNGKPIPSWIVKSKTYCRAINNNGTVTFSLLKSGAITGIVDSRFVDGATITSIYTSTDTNNPSTTKIDVDQYDVVVTCNVLNIRSGHNTGCSVVGTTKKGDVHTVVTTSDGWGKIKSGWINLNYTKKCKNA